MNSIFLLFPLHWIHTKGGTCCRNLFACVRSIFEGLSADPQLPLEELEDPEPGRPGEAPAGGRQRDG